MLRKYFWLLSLLLLSGCRDAIDLEDRSYVLSAGADAKNFYAAVADAKAASEGKTEYTKTFCAARDTIRESIEAIDLLSDKKLYLGHIKAFILSPDFCRDSAKMAELSDFLRSNTEISKKAEILTASGEISKVIKDSSFFIQNYRENNKDELVGGYSLNAGDFCKAFARGGGFLIPQIDKDGESVCGAAIINDGAFAGFLGKDELRGVLWLKTSGRSVLSVPSGGGFVPVEVKSVRRKFSFSQNENALIIAPEATVRAAAEYGGDTPEAREFLAREAARIIGEEIAKSYEILRNKNADVYGFRRRMEIKNYELYEKAAATPEIWRETFRNAEMRPSVRAKIYSNSV
ncbi:MAG: hypothetical protein LBU36_02170 [Clostridiales bacterium]|jgi:Ger(x)C family germination protein|nr:hypothetical protein [Clostridiales bacterium]